jgi:hypothetical protein
MRRGNGLAEFHVELEFWFDQGGVGQGTQMWNQHHLPMSHRTQDA